jgi:hypothetical protein
MGNSVSITERVTIPEYIFSKRRQITRAPRARHDLRAIIHPGSEDIVGCAVTYETSFGRLLWVAWNAEKPLEEEHHLVGTKEGKLKVQKRANELV